jgi:hypothetical protein
MAASRGKRGPVTLDLFGGDQFGQKSDVRELEVCDLGDLVVAEGLAVPAVAACGAGAEGAGFED